MRENDPSLARQVLVSAVTAAPLYAMFLGAFAANKVQGFALAKAVGVVMVPCIVAYFVTGPWQNVFGLVPQYWALKVFWLFDEGAVGPALGHAVIGLAWQAVLLTMLGAAFLARRPAVAGRRILRGFLKGRDA